MSEKKFNIDIDAMLNEKQNDKVGAEGDSEKSLKKETTDDNSANNDRPDFEESLHELDRIVDELQRSDLPLDRSMHLFRRGTELVQICREQLSKAEHEVKELLEDGSEIDYSP